MSMVLTPRREDGWSVVGVDGEIDMATMSDLRDRLAEVIADSDRPPQVIVDLTNVTFCDASGLGVLIGAHGQIQRRGGQLRVVCPDGKDGKVLRVLRLTRATHTLPVHRTLGDALTAPVRSGSAGTPAAR